MHNFAQKRRGQAGFNLIELMIVIAIIGLLIGVGAIAWGAMIRAGNENSATQVLDRIKTFQAQFASRNRGRFGSFDDLIRMGLLDDRFAGEEPVVNGYKFKMTREDPSPAKPAFFAVNADPQVSQGVTATGNRHFYTDSSMGAIKATDEDRPSKGDDPSI